jgi:hypothetical protein
MSLLWLPGQPWLLCVLFLKMALHFISACYNGKSVVQSNTSFFYKIKFADSKKRFTNNQIPFILDLRVSLELIMGDSDRHMKMEIDYSSVVDQKLKECDELMTVNSIIRILLFPIIKFNLGCN